MTIEQHHCLLWSPEDVTIRFLQSLSLGDVELAEHLLSRDVTFRAGWRPAHTGRAAVGRRLTRLAAGRTTYDAVIHSIDCAGSTVLTARTDAFVRGRLRVQVSVRGTAAVVDGKIVSWTDRISARDLLGAFGRGVIGVLVPSMRAQMPAR
ncbi:limonene-1,2-epoxide hydrolase family protein [Williamsia sp. CHRR-6]|uniref:limonene-1,2-epoxide hydrolase family protein n=1 Tax=Williamsia sp. CHRR-6 TaxID=2835871 RepID=UPI001BD961D1|nr:limonene-1,2-epoxide hydrolase family protein [Williamsia sp. CHRR-6]MBT0566672.1 nuclear transport factor 2 family protein [Williamsia sp. CHRR-6]